MTQVLSDPVHAIGAVPSARRLRAALRSNVVFSSASGLVLLTGGVAATPWGLGPAWLTPLVGAGLLPFAAAVARIAVLPATALRRQAGWVIAADATWVVASLILLITADLPAPGAAVVAAVAAIVATLAGWQTLGLVAIRHDDPLGDLEIVQASRVLPAPPQRVWPLLTDHDLYGRLAPNLSTAQVISEPDQPLRRRCTDTSGNGWEETCTLWDDGRRYAVEVDTSDYPYPLATMRGLWQVDPDPAGSRVTMRFAYRADATLRGGLFAVVFRPLFRPVLARVFSGWRSHLTD
ncbi:type II toxin-antitoxin system RatA family toxin [Micromonospora halophytica]|uniref:Ribosome association toxin PasT (RatA) of the RatAB toxin-antitoxin module n=1 Tax=Micromonospora halophytica TaxID=47864 RepID=A0A1C5ITY7_9ACTN|nr:SRPBCC family protein [Micromonospora halophytica]SCG61790.1 Ribosome association toxin PasT (RatA) of the RatAB toxin-antitoxin module [Micromonospora halophytica]